VRRGVVINMRTTRNSVSINRTKHATIWMRLR
jgi:hypothetical protein